MKALSLWTPYSQLAVNGFKKYETRPFAPPSTLKVGDRFAIASTKQIKSEQEIAADHPRLARYYRHTGLPDWRSLSRGCIVGTVKLGRTVEIVRNVIVDLPEEEYVYGDWRPGRFAWELLNPIVFATPIPVRGQQGIWDYRGEILEDQGGEVQTRS